MKIHLAGIGWVTDSPGGNRLRWSYPEDGAAGADKFLGFPEVIVVERAPVDENIAQEKPGLFAVGGGAFPASGTLPLSWWDSYGTVHLSGILPVRYKLLQPAQAISFLYQGPAARMVVKDSTSDRVVTDRIISNGDPFYWEAPAMDEIVFLSFSATLKDFKALDLFKDRPLKWEVIAEIRVEDTSYSSYEDVQKRYTVPTTLSASEWKELVEMAKAAQASTPAGLVKGDPTPWQNFGMALGLRWEFALLYGHAFFDGPRTESFSLDKINGERILKGVPLYAMAYRVREKANRVGRSNIVVCPPWFAPPVIPPGVPQYLNPEVHVTDEDKFEASLTMRWQQFDLRAIGVEMEEEISASPAIGSPPQTEVFHHRSKRPEDPPLQGETARVFDVSFHDVLLKARARATDAWDRVSAPTAWTALTSLPLRHEPPPPPLASARFTGGTVRIVRQVGDPDFPDWQPDVVVKKAGGKVFLYRQVANPRVADGTVTEPLHVEGSQYKTTVAGVAAMADFENGYIVAGRVKASIAKIMGGNVYFEAPDEGGGTVTLFSSGPARLQQNPTNGSLWSKVAEFPAVGLPTELVFIDPVPGPSEKADVLSYCSRISFLGRLGPASNVVQAFRIPATPVVPPPFTVEVLGVDFYNRTMVKIRLTNPVTSGRYTVGWADGPYDTAQFGAQAVPGEYRAQEVQKDRYLYDVLSLPIPANVNRVITIGIQRVNEGGGQSDFQTVQIVLEAGP